MKTIYKYTLDVTDLQSVKMPARAEILTVQTQMGKPCLWASVDTSSPQEDRVIETLGTGNPAPPLANTERKYIATYQMMAGELVFHVFERTIKTKEL